MGVISAGMDTISLLTTLSVFGKATSGAGNETQPGMVSCLYTIKDTKWYRGVLYIGAYINLFIVPDYVLMFHSSFLPTGGDLTIAEFAENHNYAKYYDIKF